MAIMKECPYQKEKWYQEACIKKPSLQIKILRYIGLEGTFQREWRKLKQDLTIQMSPMLLIVF